MAETTDPSEEFTQGERRRRRRVYIALGVAGVVLVAAYVVLIRLPPSMADDAEQEGKDCRIPIRDTGVGNAAACRKAPAFAGVLRSDRARAAHVTWENDYRTTVLEADLAAFRDLDADRRDAALQRAYRLARGHDEFFVGPENTADTLGALGMLIQMARDPRGPDVEAGITPLPIAGARAAVRLGAVDALGVIAARIADDRAPERRAYLCLADKGPCTTAPIEGAESDAIGKALVGAEAGMADPDILELLGEGVGGLLPWRAHLSPYTLDNSPVLADPVVVEKLAAALVTRAGPYAPAPAKGKGKGKPVAAADPRPVESLLSTAWWLYVEAARARWLLGDPEGARAALRNADSVDADPRVSREVSRWFLTTALRAVLHPETLGAWIGAHLADAGIGASHLHLNRALFWMETGRADEILASLPPASTCTGPDDHALCDAIEWVRLAMQLRAGKPPAPTGPVPKPAPDQVGSEATWCSSLKAAELRAVIADAVIAGPEARARLRWWCQLGHGSLWHGDAAAPMRLYALGFLAEGKTAGVYIDLLELDLGARLEQRVRFLAEEWHGDMLSAAKWQAAREALDAAMAAHPEMYTHAADLDL